MTNRVDDIFSPERLRDRWQRRQDGGAKRDDSKTAAVGPQGPIPVFARLQSRIEQRFPGEPGEPLKLMMNELHELLLRRFSPTDDAEVSGDDKAALNLAIGELLNEIEDLVEALEL
jgi:hypothetical protein